MGLGLNVVNEQNVKKKIVSMKHFWMPWLAQAEMCILVNSVVDAVTTTLRGQHYLSLLVAIYTISSVFIVT